MVAGVGMELQSLSACYFPSTVVIVDDSRSYLRSVRLVLNPDMAIYKVCDNPVRVVEFFNDIYHFNPFTNRCLIHPEEESLEHRIIDVDIRKVHDEIYNKERFGQVSVLLVDYAMPGMNGLELCSKIDRIRTGPIKKILLTGEADERIAIDAFNSGLIDKFIRKDERHFEDVVQKAIHFLQHRYFQDLSKIVIDSLIGDYVRPPSCLNDPAFISFFMHHIHENKIIEMYLMDSSGAFLLLDVKGKPSWLVVKSEEDMHSLLEFAHAEKAPAGILEALGSRTQLPYFYAEQGLVVDTSDWERFMHPARLVQGNDMYYCAYITDTEQYALQTDRMQSFKDYSNKVYEKEGRDIFCAW